MRTVILLLVCLVVAVMADCDGIRQGTEVKVPVAPAGSEVDEYLEVYTAIDTPDSLLEELRANVQSEPIWQPGMDSTQWLRNHATWWYDHIRIVQRVRDEYRTRRMKEETGGMR